MKKRLLVSAILLLQGCGGGSGGSGETPPGNQPDPAPGNQPPQVSDVALTDANGGALLSGDTLVLSYRYQDAEGDPEGDSDIRWFRDDQPFTPQDAYQYTVVAADRGHRIGVSVAAVAKSGNTTPLAPQLTEVTVPPLQVTELSWQLDQSSHTGVVGDELVNPVTATSRPVQYQSSDPAVAFVNPDGKVRMQQAGRVTITASAAETNQYQAASASYELVIRDNEFVVSGWVGEYNTKMHIDAQQQDVALAVSRGTGCANVVVFGCPGYGIHQMPVGTTQATTDVITLEQGGVIQAETASAMGRGVIDTADYFDTLEHPAVVEFNNKIWLIGGYSQRQVSDRIYSSVDGRAWKREYADSNAQALPAYYKANVVEFNNELWLIGGVNAQNQSDARIWKSADGVDWQLLKNEAQTGILKSTTLVNGNGQLWLVGVNDDKETVLWSSLDGMNWLKVGNLPEHQKYYWHGHMVSVPAVDNQPARLLYHHPEIGIYVRPATSSGSWQKLSDTEMGSAARFVVSGTDVLLIDPQNQSLKRASISDVSQWQTLESDHGYPAQVNAVVMYAKRQLWLVAGKAGAESFVPQQGWIYSSPDDGEHWINRSESRTLPSTNQAALFSRDGTLHLMKNRGDTLVSQDGLFWSAQQKAQDSERVTARSVVTFKGQQYALAGSSAVLRLADNAWQQVVTLSNTYARLVVHNNRLLVIGDTAIYASTDGTSWAYWSASPLLNRSSYEVVSYNGNIIVLMGMFSYNTNFHGKVYTSVDGKNWVQHAASGTGITGRFSFSVTTHNDYLWMIGGARNEPGNYSTKNGVWRSRNGYQWELVTSGFAFSQRHGASLVSHDGQLIFLGGLGSGGYQNSIWRSADGKNWQRGFYKNLALTPLQ